MANFDFSNNGKRPSAAQIVAKWKAAGKPGAFVVEYGEARIEFTRYAPFKWDAYGYGGGIKSDAVIKALNMEGAKALATADDLY